VGGYPNLFLFDRLYKELNMAEQRTENGLLQKIKKFLYGFFAHGMVEETTRSRLYMEYYLILITYGNIIGIPFATNYYSLRLLPYHIPLFKPWKRWILREKDIFEMIREC